MKKNWLIITISIVITAILAVIVIIFTNLNKTSANIPTRVTETVQVKKSDPLTFNGISKSTKTQSITLNQSLGNNLDLEKQNGEAVSQGELVATYYSLKDYNTLWDKKNKVHQKNAEIDSLKKDVQNNSAKITTLNNEVNQLNNEIIKLRENAPNKIYSQFDGVFTVATNGDGMKPVAEITSNEATVIISVSEYDFNHLYIEQKVNLSPVDSETNIKGKITKIATRPDNTKSNISTYSAQIKPAEELRNGSHVQVTIPMKEIKVPNSAVKEEDKKFYVYKAIGSKYTKKEIQGSKKNSYFVVTSGIKSNDSIVKNYKDAE